MTFYLRLENQAVLLGDNSLEIVEHTTEDFWELRSIFRSYYYDLIFIGSYAQCNKLLDWILESVDSHYSDCSDSYYPLTYLDARNFIKLLELEQP
jgi:hypothetical protein